MSSSLLACGGGAQSKSPAHAGENTDGADENASHGRLWQYDVDRAMGAAKSANKDVLLFFTGSDWCMPCKEFHRDVLEKKAFQSYAKKHYVLVELDYPSDKSRLSKAQQEHNAKWEKKFRIDKFPTVILTEASGKRYSADSLGGMTPEEFNRKLTEQRENREKRDELLDQASKTKGLKKARLLDEVLSLKTYVDDRPEFMSAIVANAEDDSSLIDKYKLRGQETAIKEVIDDVDALVFSQTPGVMWSKTTQEQLESGLKQLNELEKEHDLTLLPQVDAGVLSEFLFWKAAILCRLDGRMDDGLKVLKDVYENEDYAMELRQGIGINLAELYAELRGMDEFLAQYDKTIALAPESDLGKEYAEMRDQFTAEMKRQGYWGTEL